MELPRFIMVKSNYNEKYLRYIHEDGKVQKFLQFSGEDDIVSPYAKFEVEKAKSGNGLVHLKCCHNNKYWVRRSHEHHWIVAAATRPEEDQFNWSCTLFKPVYVDSDAKTVRFLHVQLGHYACLWRAAAPFESCLYAGSKDHDKDLCDVYTIIDITESYWESLLVVHRHVTDNSQRIDNRATGGTTTVAGSDSHAASGDCSIAIDNSCNTVTIINQYN